METEQKRETREQLREQLKEQAEQLYAKAMCSAREGSTAPARYYGREAIQLYQRYGVETLEDACPTRMQVLGVNLPDIMHQEVVRQRLAARGVRLE